MSQDPDVRDLLAPMTERAVDLDAPAFRVDRERVLARMAQARRRAGPSRLGYILGAAAGVAALVVGAWLFQRGGGSSSSAALEVMVSEGSATQVRGSAHSAVTPKQSTHIAAAGDLETAADSKARVRTADGLQIELEGRTRVALGELQPSTSRVRLLGGGIRCTVPHRTAPQAFQVVTPDVTVVDLGTVFTVNVEGPHATRVSVEEGEVLVRHALGQTRVHAPNAWSSVAPPQEPPAPMRAGDLAASAPSAMPTGSKAAGGRPVPAATLAQEAQLLRQGLAAERQGRFSEAISAFTQLIAKYPDSPLVPDARAALTRVEARARQ